MKIGIDARMYRSGVAGIGRYSQNLIRNLLMLDKENEYILFMTSEDAKEFINFSIKNKELKKQPIHNFKLNNWKIVVTDIPHYSLAEQTKLPKIIAQENLDLIHFLNFNYPVRYRGKFIVTIHDFTLLFYPDTAKRTNFIKQSAFKYTMKKVCQNSAQIIAVSENTKKDIMKMFKVKSVKLKVIYEAADDKLIANCISHITREIQELKKRYAISDKPVVLTVGQFRPHKNLVGLVEAFGILRKQLPCQLVILGKPDPKHTSLKEAVSKNHFKNDIIMPGFVSDNELAAWYKIASCFVFPSFYEGFGLPGLEAMQSGTPVVAANQSCLPEIYQDAALYFDPFKTEDISAKIKMVLESKTLRADLIRKGKIQAQCFSWEKTASETLKVYKQVIHGDLS